MTPSVGLHSSATEQERRLLNSLLTFSSAHALLTIRALHVILLVLYMHLYLCSTYYYALHVFYSCSICNSNRALLTARAALTAHAQFTTHTVHVTLLLLHLQGHGSVPFGDLDSRQAPSDPQASKEAQRFFQHLAQQALQSQTAVDVLAVVQAAVNVPLLGAFVQQTGGTIMAHHSKSSMPHPSSAISWIVYYVLDWNVCTYHFDVEICIARLARRTVSLLRVHESHPWHQEGG